MPAELDAYLARTRDAFEANDATELDECKAWALRHGLGWATFLLAALAWQAAS